MLEVSDQKGQTLRLPIHRLVSKWNWITATTLTAVAGRGRYEYQDGLDADWLPLEFIGRSDISEYDHTSQEFRLTSPTEQGRQFSWVGGVYLDQQDQEIDRTVMVIDGTFGLPEMKQ